MCQALAAVAEAQFSGGDPAGAKQTLTQANAIAARIKEISDRRADVPGWGARKLARRPSQP